MEVFLDTHIFHMLQGHYILYQLRTFVRDSEVSTVFLGEEGGDA